MGIEGEREESEEELNILLVDVLKIGPALPKINPTEIFGT